ncbi:type II toxin-antitoxin system VapC family toxin [Acidisoma cladoniae]|jgi:ribonuclease VapC|uniref:type II toxin-antitoxin system VapC family toxin n=1 Tax=Acidisoma cladoniae TaxID=3040935 RepID=UPI00254BB072|nr:type II toxin-antitoxin system VapC family toxin [Acidisoma sp. PAMC 29798]
MISVLDSSAVLALLLDEPGAETVKATLPGALLSAVNLAEVISKLCERGMSLGDARSVVEDLGVEVIDFGSHQAYIVGELRRVTRSAGLSLGDRACLALGRLREASVVTADAIWMGLSGFEIVLIRSRGA